MDLENSERGGQDSCPLTSYIDTFDFSENFMQIIQNFE